MFVGSAVGTSIDARLADAVEILVPTIVQHELVKWALREDGINKAQEIVALTGEHFVVPLESAIAILSATLAREHKLHTTDSIIYATARLHDASVLTCDAHFKDLYGVEYFEKSS